MSALLSTNVTLLAPNFVLSCLFYLDPPRKITSAQLEEGARLRRSPGDSSKTGSKWSREEELGERQSQAKHKER